MSGENLQDAPTRRTGGRVLLWMTAVIVLGVGVSVVGLWRGGGEGAAADGPPALRVEQLTERTGDESWPDLSPDGRWIVYVSSESGNDDIYVQALGGHDPTNLTESSAAADTTPRFSPDGEQIAFRSGRDGGGIFIMGHAGQEVRRLTDEGYDPDWSPDGTRIVYATEGALEPDSRAQASRLRIVDIVSGERSRLPVLGAVQPRWSPDGRHIAYENVVDGRRDIAAVSPEGGDPVLLTDDPPLDRGPAWSPDGRYIYFASDRSGDMNLWRMPFAMGTGGPSGDPEPVSVPSTGVGQIALSRDGRRIVYRSAVRTGDLRSPPEGDIWMATLQN